MPNYAQIECVLTELDRNHSCIYKENYYCSYGYFAGNDKNVYVTKENIDSRNMKLKFHLVWNNQLSLCFCAV
jgi:hypothetical protein